ncbi:MAG TPA: hypothetical protein VF615_25655 [Longimicrobiaceae bacterium]
MASITPPFSAAQLVRPGKRLPRPTAAEKARIRELHPHHSAAEIASKLGEPWTAQRVHDWASRLELRKVRPWTEAEDTFLREHYPSEGAAWVAGQLGRPRGGVRARAEDLKLRHGRFWSDDDLEYLRLNYARLPTAEIAEALGRTAPQVHDQAKALGVRKEAWTPAEEQLLIDAYPVQTAPVIAAQLGRSPTQVYGRARKLGLRRRPPLSAEAEELLWALRDVDGVVGLFAEQLGLPAAVVKRELQRMEAAGGNCRDPAPQV